MIRKLWGLCLVGLLVLSGCQKQVALNYDALLYKSLTRSYIESTNHAKPYFKYYVSPTVGVRNKTQLSSILVMEAVDILLNLKVNDIVAHALYDKKDVESQLKDVDALIFQSTGTFRNRHDEAQTVIFSVIDFEDYKALILENDVVDMIAIAPNGLVPIVFETMMMTMRSIEVDRSDVVAAYSDKEIINMNTTYQNFFDHAVPENGALEDMFDRLNPDNE